MASYHYNYYYPLVALPDGSYTFADGASFDNPPRALQDQDGDGPGLFEPGELVITRGGVEENYFGWSTEGIVTIKPNGELTLYTDREDGDLPLNTVLQIAQTSVTVCFLVHTMIATPAGERTVETLSIGDLVLTTDGRAAPVRWVGVQTVMSVFADRLRNFPVRIAAGALGEGLPVRDLLVSPDHALFLDGVLVHAAALVNGTTIVRETAMPERFTWFHVELEDHALILAEGVPAETFLDTVTRRRFDNWAEYEARYGDTGAVLAEIPAPRIKSARQLPRALARRLAARAAAARDDFATVA